MKVIAYKHLPVRIPAKDFLLIWLLFDRLSTPIWFQAVAWTLMGLYAMGCVAVFFKQEEVSLRSCE